jgi:sialate O-acetylesterase
MTERSKVVLGGLAAVFWLVGWARAAPPQDERTLLIPSVLSDGMVLQQQMPIRLWGMAEIGQTVVVELTRSDEAGVCRSGKACADADGTWLIELESMEASFTPLSIRISAGGEQIVIRDVLIGEVWLASGQSNMHLPLQNIIGAEKLLAEAQNGRIRMFCQEHLGKEYFPEPRFDVAGGQWIGGDRPDLLRLSETSGIGYTFALKLFEALNRNGGEIPVAVMNAATGATSIHAWLSGAKTHSDPTLEARYPREWVRERQGMSFNQATAQFNHKVAPLANLSIRGFVWSQGENDVGGADAALYYRRALVGLIDDWRDQFRNAKAPFIVAQLAPHVYWDDLGTLAGMRQAQIEACAERDRTVAIPIHDLPLTWNVGPFLYKAPVHPLDKMPAGERMARAARALAYGEAIEYTGPTYAGMTRVCP